MSVSVRFLYILNNSSFHVETDSITNIAASPTRTSWNTCDNRWMLLLSLLLNVKFGRHTDRYNLVLELIMTISLSEIKEKMLNLPINLFYLSQFICTVNLFSFVKY